MKKGENDAPCAQNCRERAKQEKDKKGKGGQVVRPGAFAWSGSREGEHRARTASGNS